MVFSQSSHNSAIIFSGIPQGGGRIHIGWKSGEYEVEVFLGIGIIYAIFKKGNLFRHE